MATSKTDFLLMAISILPCSSGIIIYKHFNTVNLYYFEFSTPSRLWVDFRKFPSSCLLKSPWMNLSQLCCLLTCFRTFKQSLCDMKPNIWLCFHSFSTLRLQRSTCACGKSGTSMCTALKSANSS